MAVVLAIGLVGFALDSVARVLILRAAGKI
jgi:hypothetical protein